MSDLRLCVGCGVEKPETKFKLIRGKWRGKKCHTCTNDARRTLNDLSRVETDRIKRALRISFETRRANFFLELWFEGGRSYGECLDLVNRMYPDKETLR